MNGKQFWDLNNNSSLCSIRKDISGVLSGMWMVRCWQNFMLKVWIDLTGTLSAERFFHHSILMLFLLAIIIVSCNLIKDANNLCWILHSKCMAQKYLPACLNRQDASGFDYLFLKNIWEPHIHWHSFIKICQFYWGPI